MRLFIETCGCGAEIVMLHGWGMHGGIFQRLADSLADHYRVHRVDLPGHGASPTVDPMDAKKIADGLYQQFPHAVHVLGWSLGGLIAQYWAQRHPSQVKSMVLIATSPCFAQRPDWPHAQTHAALEALGASLNQAFERTLEHFLVLQMLGSPQIRTIIKAVRANLLNRGRPQGLIPALKLLLHTDGRAMVKEITCPVSIVHGCRDAITPIAAGRWLAAQLPSATFYEFAQAAHAPFLSHEAKFIEILTQHLDQHR